MDNYRRIMGYCSLCGGVVTYYQGAAIGLLKEDTEPECETCHAIQAHRIIQMAPKPKQAKDKKKKTNH